MCAFALLSVAQHIDTVKVYDPQTYEESVRIIKSEPDSVVPDFRSDAYAQSLRKIFEKNNTPGVRQSEIGFEFANHYNKSLRAYPGHVHEINDITKEVSDEFGLRYAIENGRMTTVQLPDTIGAPEYEIRTYVPQPGEEVFKVVEEMPRFPGCEEMNGTLLEIYHCAQGKLLEYVYHNIQYPAVARQMKLQGRVVVQFIVEQDGTLSNVECTRDIGGGCGEEAVRVVQAMNSMPQKWVPGRQRGVPVRVLFTLPISFKTK